VRPPLIGLHVAESRSRARGRGGGGRRAPDVRARVGRARGRQEDEARNEGDPGDRSEGDDGRPMAIVVNMAWTQPVDGVATPATMTLELTYAGTAGGVAIVAPEHVWSRYTSGRFHFSVAYPDRWTTDTTDHYDDFLNGPGVTHVGGRRLKAGGRSLASWTKTIVGIHGDSPKDYVLLGNDPTTLAGDAARMLTSTYHDYGQKLICFEVLALHGAHLYDIFWVSPITTRDAGLVTFRQMLSTYAYPLRG